MHEEIERAIARVEERTYPEGMPVHNRAALRHRIDALLRWAKLGNRAHQELEQLWGVPCDFDFDPLVDIDRVTN